MTKIGTFCPAESARSAVVWAMPDKIPSKWLQFGHARIGDILPFDLRSQPLCATQMNGNTSIVVAHYQLPTTPHMRHRCSVSDHGLPVYGSERCHADDFVLGELMFKIVQTLHLCPLDMAMGIEPLFTIINICFVVVVLQSI